MFGFFKKMFKRAISVSSIVKLVKGLPYAMIFDFAVDVVRELAKEQLEGAEKKKILENKVTAFTMEQVKKINFPGQDEQFEKFIEEVLTRYVVPVATQKVYEILKIDPNEVFEQK